MEVGPRKPGLFNDDDLALVASGLNLIQQGITIFDEELKLVAWNRRFMEIYGLPDTLLHRGISFEAVLMHLAERDEFGPGDINELVSERVRVAKEFEAHYIERTRPNGMTIAVEGQPLRQGGWVAVYTDITAQKHQETLLRERSELLSDRLLQHSGRLAETNRQLTAANRALQETERALTASEERMQVINQSIPAHIAYLDADLIYRFSNNRLPEVLGIPDTKIIGKSMYEVFPPDTLRQVMPSVEKALAGETAVIEFENPSANTPDHAARVTFTPELDQNGRVAGLFVLSMDITDERRAMNADVQSKRMEAATQLTGGLAHDLNNILTVITGNLTRLEKAGGVDPTIIESTQRATRRAGRLMESLVSFSRSRVLQPETTDISKTLQGLVSLAKPNVPPNITLSLNLPDKPIIAHVDESALLDAIINLLFNARDALKDGGNIWLKALKSEGDTFQIIVADDGEGFEEHALSRAFEPFFSTKKTGHGTGLGLSMVQGFVAQSGGTVEIQQRQPSGAQVVMTLPSAKVQSLPVTEEKAGDLTHLLNMAAEAGLVLIVEDQEEIRISIREQLQQYDLSILEASSAEEALTLVHGVPDIGSIITDITMTGEKDGVDLAFEVRELRPDIPLLIISGLAASDSRWQLANSTFATVRKPFDESKLIAAFAALFSKPGKRALNDAAE